MEEGGTKGGIGSVSRERACKSSRSYWVREYCGVRRFANGELCLGVQEDVTMRSPQQVLSPGGCTASTLRVIPLSESMGMSRTRPDEVL